MVGVTVDLAPDPGEDENMCFKEFRITDRQDLGDGEMKSYDIDGHKILLRRLGDQYFAGIAFCPHLGAPLDEGAMSRERIVCPWHHAAFDVKSGELLEPPALDSLPQFETKIDGDDVFVVLPEDVPKASQPKATAHNAANDGRTFVILGGGAAGNAAAESLRHLGFDGRLVMVSPEETRPYARPTLTKSLLRGDAREDEISLRPEEFYRNRDIELLMGRRATAIDTDSHQVTLDNNQNLGYDKLLLAMGGTPRRANVPGENTKNVHTIRNVRDALEVAWAAKDSTRVAIVGASFLGLETASSLRQHGIAVTVIAPEELPLKRVVGPEIARRLKRKHQEEGTTFALGETLKHITGNGNSESVVTESGRNIDADMVILGIGVEPASADVQGLEVENDGSIAVDDHFRVADDIYAAGDLARFPD